MKQLKDLCMSVLTGIGASVWKWLTEPMDIAPLDFDELERYYDENTPW